MGIPPLTQRVAQRHEAAVLLFFERHVFRQGHHHPLNVDRLARREVLDQCKCLPVRNADPTDAGVDAYMNWNSLPKPGGRFFKCLADRRIYHRRDVLCRRLQEITIVERAHQQYRFCDPRFAKRNSLLQLDDRESGNGRFRLQYPRHVANAHAIGIVLDHRQDGTPLNP